MHKIIDTAGKLHQKKLWIDCKSGRSPSEVLAQCTYLKHTEGLDLIIVDYLQIMRLGRKTESRYVEVSGISRELTECAKILEIPMIALAQLSRGASERSDKRPIVTDLRGSGDIEQDAHKIIFLHVPAKYDQKEDPHLMEIHMPKNRSGEADVYIKHYVDQATSTHRAYTEEDARNWQAKGFQG
jgi:replicative DNA helicase